MKETKRKSQHWKKRICLGRKNKEKERPWKIL